jgi:hypothetical protein
MMMPYDLEEGKSMKIKGRTIWVALAVTVSLLMVFSCAKEKEPYKVGAVFFSHWPGLVPR